MPRRRVTPLDHEEALAVCAKILAKHPDILERREDGLYRHQLGSEEMRQVMFDYRACERVADAYRAKEGLGWGARPEAGSIDSGVREVLPAKDLWLSP